MTYPDNWDTMTQEKKEKWLYTQSVANGRFAARTKENAIILANLILEHEQLSKIKIGELRAVLDKAEEYLIFVYGQVSLRQAKDIFESLPEDGYSISSALLNRIR